MQQIKTLGILLFALANISPLWCASISYIGDVEIYVNSTAWKCDKIFCPIDAYRCVVTKQKSPSKATELIRVNTCYSKQNQVLLEETRYEDVDEHQNISLNLTAYRNGITSSVSGSSFTTNDGTLEDIEKELDLSLRDINSDVQANLNHINQHIEQHMDALREQLAQTLGNLFN